MQRGYLGFGVIVQLVITVFQWSAIVIFYYWAWKEEEKKEK